MARVRLPFRDEFEDGQGVIHGGLIGLIIFDTAGNFAVGSNVSSGSTVKTGDPEFKMSLHGASPGRLARHWRTRT